MVLTFPGATHIFVGQVSQLGQLRQIDFFLHVWDPPWASSGLFSQQAQKCRSPRRNMQGPYKASARLVSTDSPLVKASHVVRARVRVGKTTKSSCKGCVYREW